MINYHRLTVFSAKKQILILFTICFSLTVLDILVVENFYRPFCTTSEDWQAIWKWHLMYGSLIIILPLFVSVKLRSLIPLGTWLFIIFGLEDTLFYTLQGRLPFQYLGISMLGIWEPFLMQVLSINIIGLILICAYTLGIGKVFRITAR